MNVNIFDINQAVKADCKEYLAATDHAYNLQVYNIAKDICTHREERPIILLSGPSGSGKTTTAMMLECLLDEWGYETHTLSMDNYFIPLSQEEKRMAKEGNLDFESPDRVDIGLLNEQLESMVKCEPVTLPKYDFVHSRRLMGNVFTRKPGEMIVLEGIHVLNPDVITIPDEETAKIYISVRTRIVCDDLILHPSKIRLVRRMIRDKSHRGRSAKVTLDLFPSVELGAERYIMPFKTRSTYDVDTFISYELGVYKNILLDELRAIGNSVSDLVQVLEQAKSVPEKSISEDSLIREFIGNGKFEY